MISEDVVQAPLSCVSPSIYGTWANVYLGITNQLVLNADGTYQFTTFDTTSTVAGNESITSGTYILSGGYMVFTPNKWSCTGNPAIETDSYNFTSGTLHILGGIIGKGADEATYTETASGPLGTGLTLTLGCIVDNLFTAEPLVSVTATGNSLLVEVGPPSIYGTWYEEYPPNDMFQLTLNTDCTYEFDTLEETSNVAGNENIQKGTYSLAGDVITFSLIEETCIGTQAKASATYSFAGDDVFTFGAFLLKKQPSADAGASDAGAFASGLQLVVGCSIGAGPFTPYPLATLTVPDGG